jgi:hypothetical protein
MPGIYFPISICILRQRLDGKSIPFRDHVLCHLYQYPEVEIEVRYGQFVLLKWC